MRRHPGDDLVEVELIEDDLDQSERDPTGWIPERWAGYARRLAGRRDSLIVRVAACVGVVGLVAVVAQGGAAAADIARLAAVPGLAASLDEPLHEVWAAAGAGAVLGIAGDLIVSEGSGGRGVMAVREADGEVLWETDVAGGYCSLESGDPERMGWQRVGLPVLGASDVSLVCQSTMATPADDGAAGPQSTRVEVLDVVTGAVTASATLVGGDQGVMITGPDVVTAGFDADQRLVATRWSWHQGRTLWEYRSEEPVTGAATVEGTVVRLWPSLLEVAGDAPLAIDLTTGTEVDPESPAVSSEWHLEGPTLPDGAKASTVGDDGGPHYRVTEADGSVRFFGDGYIFPLAVRDPADELLVVLDAGMNGLIGVDVRTGAERWRRGSTAGVPVAVLDGTVVVSNGVSLQAVDAEHGSDLWSAGGDVTFYSGGVVTDGRSWLTLETADGRPWLVAVGIHDGAERWRAAAPDGALALVGVSSDGTALVQTTTSLVAFDP